MQGETLTLGSFENEIARLGIHCRLGCLTYTDHRDGISQFCHSLATDLDTVYSAALQSSVKAESSRELYVFP